MKRSFKKLVCSILISTLTMAVTPVNSIQNIYAAEVSTKQRSMEQILSGSTEWYDVIYRFRETSDTGNLTIQEIVKASQQRALEILERAKNEGKVENYESFFTSNSIRAIITNVEILKEIVALNEVIDVTLNSEIEVIDSLSDIRTQSRTTNYIYVPDGDSVEWGVKAVHAEKVWEEFGITGEGVTIGIIDTGVNYKLPALRASYKGYDAATGSFDNSYYKDFLEPEKTEPEASPENDHGTHVAGTILGKEIGGVNQIGVAPGAKFISARAVKGTHTNSASLLAAGDWMYQMKPDIINNSWGGTALNDPLIRNMVDSWRKAGIMVVFASGNKDDGRGIAKEGSIVNPAGMLNVIAVGAIDRNKKIAPFSMRGPSPYDNTKEVIKPEFTAPGVQVRSINASGKYISMNGTSMAAPHVTGVLALMKEANPDISMEEATQILKDTAQPLTDENYPVSPNMVYGYGIIDAYSAVANSKGREIGSISGRIEKNGIRNMSAYQRIVLSSLQSIDSLPYENTDRIEVEQEYYIPPIQANLIQDNTMLRIDISDINDTGVASIQISKTGEEQDWEILEQFELDKALEKNTSVRREYSLLPYQSNEGSVYIRIIYSSGLDTNMEKLLIRGVFVYNVSEMENIISKDSTQVTLDKNQEVQLQEMVEEEMATSNLISTDSNAVRENFSDISTQSISLEGESNPSQEDRNPIQSQLWIGEARDENRDNNLIEGSQESTSVDVTTHHTETEIIKTSAEKDGYAEDISALSIKNPEPISLKHFEEIPFKPMIKVLNSGKYTYADESTGEYHISHAVNVDDPLLVEISAYGYETRKIEVDLRQMKDQRLNDVILEPAMVASATGRVLDEDQNSIAGVKASILEDEYVEEVLSDTNGEYSIKAAYEGNYTIRYSKYGYLTKTMKVNLRAGENQLKNVTLYKLSNLTQESQNYGFSNSAFLTRDVLTSSGRPLGAAMQFVAPRKGGILKEASIYLVRQKPYEGSKLQVGVLGYDSQGRLRELVPFKSYTIKYNGWCHFDFSDYYIISEKPIFITVRYDTEIEDSIGVLYSKGASQMAVENSYSFDGALSPIHADRNIPVGGYAMRTEWFYGTTSSFASAIEENTVDFPDDILGITIPIGNTPGVHLVSPGGSGHSSNENSFTDNMEEENSPIQKEYDIEDSARNKVGNNIVDMDKNPSDLGYRQLYGTNKGGKSGGNSSNNSQNGKEEKKTEAMALRKDGAIPNGFKAMRGHLVPENTIDRAWKYDSSRGKWQLLDGNNQAYKNQWLLVYTHSKTKSGVHFSWFRFDQNGDMVTGWFTDDKGRTYYLEESKDSHQGELAFGKRLIDGNYYYFNISSENIEGSMHTGWLLDEQGDMYYYNSTKGKDYGKLAISWTYIDGDWKYFSETAGEKYGKYIETPLNTGERAELIAPTLDKRS